MTNQNVPCNRYGPQKKGGGGGGGGGEGGGNQVSDILMNIIQFRAY